MRNFTFISVLALAASVAATLDPADTNTKGKYPSKPSCSRMLALLTIMHYPNLIQL